MVPETKEIAVSYAKTFPNLDLPILDESRLLDEFGDDPEVLAELRELFLEHLHPLVQAIRQAQAVGDAEKAAKAVHSLKGAATTYGAERLTDVCQEVEAMVKGGQLSEAEEAINILESEMNEVFQRVNALTGES